MSNANTDQAALDHLASLAERALSAGDADAYEDLQAQMARILERQWRAGRK